MDACSVIRYIWCINSSLIKVTHTCRKWAVRHKSQTSLLVYILWDFLCRYSTVVSADFQTIRYDNISSFIVLLVLCCRVPINHLSGATISTRESLVGPVQYLHAVLFTCNYLKKINDWLIFYADGSISLCFSLFFYHFWQCRRWDNVFSLSRLFHNSSDRILLIRYHVISWTAWTILTKLIGNVYQPIFMTWLDYGSQRSRSQLAMKVKSCEHRISWTT